MKLKSPSAVSISVTAVILAFGLWSFRNNQQKIELLRTELAGSDQAESDQAESQQASNEPLNKTANIHAPKVPKIDVSEVKSVAAASIASRAAGRPKTPEEQQQESELNDHLSKLDNAQLEAFVSEIVATADLNDREKSWWVYRSIVVLGDHDTRQAYELFKVHSALLKNTTMAEPALGSIFSTVAKRSVEEALKLMDQSMEEMPWLQGSRLLSSIMNSISRENPAALMRLIRSRIEPLGTSAVANAVRIQLQGCRNNEDFRTVIAYVNEYGQRVHADENEMSDLRSPLFSHAYGQFVDLGFDKAIAQLKELNLPREDFIRMGKFLSTNSRGKDTGKWLEWLVAENPLPDEADHDGQEKWGSMVRSTASGWIEQDIESFGKWLDALPASPLKDASTVEYVREIVEDHPATAAEWVGRMQCPACRAFMFREIRDKHAFKSSEEAEAFRVKYDISPQ